MGKRVTIILKSEVDKKLRLIQAKEIQKTYKSVSYSKLINDIIRETLKN